MLIEGWVVAQSRIPTIWEIKYLITGNNLKGDKVYLQDPQVIKQYMRQFSHFLLCKGVFYRSVTPSKEDQNAVQLVIPKGYQKKVLQGCHDDIGHMGLKQILDLP